MTLLYELMSEIHAVRVFLQVRVLLILPAAASYDVVYDFINGFLKFSGSRDYIFCRNDFRFST